MLYEKTVSCHLCVVGGGMAGVCAAVAAARQGISVVLLQERPVLGGQCLLGKPYVDLRCKRKKQPRNGDY